MDTSRDLTAPTNATPKRCPDIGATEPELQLRVSPDWPSVGYARLHNVLKASRIWRAVILLAASAAGVVVGPAAGAGVPLGCGRTDHPAVRGGCRRERGRPVRPGRVVRRRLSLRKLGGARNGVRGGAAAVEHVAGVGGRVVLRGGRGGYGDPVGVLRVRGFRSRYARVGVHLPRHRRGSVPRTARSVRRRGRRRVSGAAAAPRPPSGRRNLGRCRAVVSRAPVDNALESTAPSPTGTLAEQPGPRSGVRLSRSRETRSRNSRSRVHPWARCVTSSIDGSALCLSPCGTCRHFGQAPAPRSGHRRSGVLGGVRRAWLGWS